MCIQRTDPRLRGIAVRVIAFWNEVSLFSIGSRHKGVRVTSMHTICDSWSAASSRYGPATLHSKSSPETSRPTAWPSEKQVRLTPVTAPVAFFAYLVAIIFARAEFALCCVRVKNLCIRTAHQRSAEMAESSRHHEHYRG